MKPFNDPAEILERTRLVDRFLDYVKIDTQSDETSASCPSTEKQLVLARQLVEEMKELGLAQVVLDENGYATAELPGEAPGTIGLCAHIDTAPAYSGEGVKPVIHEGYDGSAIVLNDGVRIDSSDNPELLKCIGDTLITSDGTTLLGSDDKSGIAIILALVEVLNAEPGIARPTLKICFNPDEEIGRGAHEFPMDRFGAPLAFTIDGGFPGEMNVETFSADKAVVRFKGVAVHPGTAKGKMVNALTWMGKLLSRLPMAETPECTEGRHGFYHPVDAKGDAAACQMQLILRDFDTEVLVERGERLKRMAAALVDEEPKLSVEVEISEQYRNMYDELSRHPEITENLKTAIEAAGLKPDVSPVRGGTDGSQLTAKGMPTPNLFAGGMNFHGPKEWVSTRGMALSVCTLLNLVQIYAERGAETVRD